jgi:hypothetical protein
MKRSRQIDDAVATARQEFEELFRLIPDLNSGHKKNALRVAELCELFIRSERPLNIKTIAEEGRIRFGRFPAEQSISNRYAGYIKPFRAAFEHLMDVRELTSRRVPSTSVDPDTPASTDLYRKLWRDQKIENDKLRDIIRQKVPIDRPIDERGNAALLPSEIELLGKWLRSLNRNEGPFEMQEIGLVVNRRAFVGKVIVPAEVYKCLQQLVRLYESGL